MTCEFTLGGHRGVEGETTMYAGIKSLAYADERTQNFIDKAYRKVRQLSEIRGGDASYAIIGSRLGDGSIDMRTARVANTVSFVLLGWSWLRWKHTNLCSCVEVESRVIMVF